MWRLPRLPNTATPKTKAGNQIKLHKSMENRQDITVAIKQATTVRFVVT
jgi:hypothetical protein